MASRFLLRLDFAEVKQAISAVADLLDPKSYEFRQTMQKAVGEGGRVLAEGLRAEIPAASVRRGRQSDPSQGSTGLMRRSIAFVVRQGKNKLSWYVLVSANRATVKAIRRGKTTVNRQPAKYIHLIDGGFRAFHRQPGLAGLGSTKNRQDWKGLRQFEVGLSALRKIQTGTETKNLSANERRAMAFLATIQNDAQKLNQYKNLQSIRRGQSFTVVPAKRYFEAAMGKHQGAAIQAILDGLGVWAAKIFERRIDRYAKRAGVDRLG